MPVTVATLNLHGSRDRWLQRRSLVVAQLLDAAADVIALQQVALPIAQGRWLRNQLNARLQVREGGRRYQYVEKRRAHPFYGLIDGVGLLTRLPLLSWDGIPLGYDGHVALRANLLLDDGATLDVATLRLHPQRHAEQERDQQVMALIGRLHTIGAAPRRILVGSFNAGPQAPAVRRLIDFYRYRSAFAEARGYEAPATFPTALRAVDLTVGLCLDYIFLSPQVGRVRQAAVLGNRPAAADPTLYPSDHVGLLAQIETG